MVWVEGKVRLELGGHPSPIAGRPCLNRRISREIETLESMETKVSEDVDLSGSIRRLGEGYSSIGLNPSFWHTSVNMDDQSISVLLCGAPFLAHCRGIRISNTVIAASSSTSRSATL